MGSGKSAVGRSLSKRLGVPFIDTDSEIEARQGCEIADIFSDSGEEAFRQMETAMLHGLCLSDTDAVISLGGGTPVRRANKSLIKKLGKVIYLKASASVLVKRLEKEAGGRPMLKGHDLMQRVASLMKEREEDYLELADMVVDVSDDDIEEICDRIIKGAEH